jgi:glycosyltransferase involved in cell wall biosynthesis
VKALFLLTKRPIPSSRIRMTECFDLYRAAGIDCTAIRIPSGILGRLGLLRLAPRFDVIVLQKKTSLHLVELAMLRRLNPRIIFDFDDAVMFHELEHRRPLTGKHVPKFLATVDHCAAVVAGNAFLASFATPNCPRVYVLPTSIDTERYRPRGDAGHGDAVTIGWVGLGGNLYYLAELAPVLQRLAKDYPALRLKIISNRFIEIPGVPIVNEPWSLEGEVAALQSVDIGVMPLHDSLWARGKCGYKILQYMGVGVPAVASPVGINTEFIQPGVTGFLASGESEWIEHLRFLIDHPAERREMGRRGRALIEARYSKTRFAERYVEIMREVGGGPRGLSR